MSTFESLTYAQGRLALSKAMCDHSEIDKWSEHVKYWQDKLEAEEKERGLTQRATDAGCDVCRDGVPGWDEEWLFCPYCGSTLRR